MRKKLLKTVPLIMLVALLTTFMVLPAFAAGAEPFVPLEPLFPDTANAAGTPGGPGTSDPNINITINGEGSDAVRIIVLMTILTVLPSILLMATSFTRIIIVFSMLRNALGLQQTPPAQVLIGLSMALTFFIMQPVMTTLYEDAYLPFSRGEIETAEFLEIAQEPLRDFMLRQTRNQDVMLFQNLSGEAMPESLDDLRMTVVIPAFITSELRAAFTIGFLIFIPFLIIDMVVASSLMSMGMMMLPPITISLPFKLMLFVLVDGWTLLVQTLVLTFNL